MSDRTAINFDEFGIPIPQLVIDTYNEEQKREVYDYLSSLDDLQLKAYAIAFTHLGTSFNIRKSNGFKEWLKLNEKKG